MEPDAEESGASVANGICPPGGHGNEYGSVLLKTTMYKAWCNGDGVGRPKAILIRLQGTVVTLCFCQLRSLCEESSTYLSLVSRIRCLVACWYHLIVPANEKHVIASDTGKLSVY